MYEKMIRFIDSDYNDLFYIPDGGKINIIYSDDRGTVTRDCKYLGETHVDIGNNCYHICQFAEIMERNGAIYEPEQSYILQALKQSEKNLFFSPSVNEPNPNLIGYMRGDFGANGREFHHSWFDYQQTLNTPEFKADMTKAVDTFREGILKNFSTVYHQCNHSRNTKINDNGRENHGFKANAGKYQYFLRVVPQLNDYNFYLYCYDKEPERTLQKQSARQKSKKRHEPDKER